MTLQLELEQEIKNIICSDQWILLVLTWLVLKWVEAKEKEII